MPSPDRQEPAWAHLIDRMPSGLLLFRDSGEMVSVNATLAGWLGYQPEDLIGRHIDHILPRGGKIFYQTHFFPLLRASGSVSELYFALRTSSGDEIPVLISAVRDEQSETHINLATFVVVNNRRQFEGALLDAWKSEQAAREQSERTSADLQRLNAELQQRNADLHTLEEKLRYSNAAKDEFVGLVAHELKNRLAVLSGTLARIRRIGDRIQADDEQDSFAYLHEEFAKMVTVVDNLLIVARPEAQVQVDLEPVRIERVVSSIVSREAQQPGAAGIEFAVESGLPLVLASADLIEQILSNFLSNARKYGTAGAPIAVSIAGDGGQVAITVVNDGQLLDEDSIARFFAPFYRDERHRTTSQGVGLGLTVCQRLAEAQNGQVRARPREGGGLAISLSLPVLVEE